LRVATIWELLDQLESTMKNKIKENFTEPLFIIAILSIVSFFILTPIVNMVLLGAIIAYGLRPIAKQLERGLRYSNISIIIAIILIIIPFILIFIYCIDIIINFAYSFISNNNLIELNNQTSSIIYQYLPVELRSSTTSIIANINDLVKNIFIMVLNYFIDIIKSLPMISLQLFVLIASVFYFARDGHKINEYLFSFIPKSRKNYFIKMISEVKVVLKSIFYGHFLTGVLIGIMATIGYTILGYPFSLFFGILTGVLQLIPIIGPWPVYLGLFINDIFAKNYFRATIVLIFGFGISLSDMYIRPMLSGRYADIHPLILLLGFLAGPIVFGLPGFILGPLILGITYAVIKAYKEEKDAYLKND
jgi:predicted PurR-regulated permease PerM